MAGDGIPVEQWCIAVARASAEARRRELLAEGLLDAGLRPRSEDDTVCFPVIRNVDGAIRCQFEPRVEQETDLPRHELIGGIAVMQEDDRDGARSLLSSRPSLHTVLYPESAVEGEYRTRRFTVLAGRETTRTRYVEYGLRFEIDLAVAYFSARLANERQRLLSVMEDGERVLDMFAGVGPFAVVLAEKAGLVVASDINPGAIHLMIENIHLNRRTNVLPVLADARTLGRILPPAFDRIIMNLPVSSATFLGTACGLCREGGWIHFYALQSREGEYRDLLGDWTHGRIGERFVRSYSPAQHHAVYDVEIRRA
jgi:tRNA (guanine37-N1)-methyltransferase